MSEYDAWAQEGALVECSTHPGSWHRQAYSCPRCVAALVAVEDEAEDTCRRETREREAEWMRVCDEVAREDEEALRRWKDRQRRAIKLRRRSWKLKEWMVVVINYQDAREVKAVWARMRDDRLSGRPVVAEDVALSFGVVTVGLEGPNGEGFLRIDRPLGLRRIDGPERSADHSRIILEQSETIEGALHGRRAGLALGVTNTGSYQTGMIDTTERRP